jgi:hypothetical protein
LEILEIQKTKTRHEGRVDAPAKAGKIGTWQFRSFHQTSFFVKRIFSHGEALSEIVSAPSGGLNPEGTAVPTTLPKHLRPRREKVFGEGRAIPLDRNAKVRILTLARALMKRTQPGKHYGQITAKQFAILRTLLFDFHNAASGKCFPSYEAIQEKADCARSTVAEAIKALEGCGLLTWCNRLIRVREACQDLFGRWGTRWRVLRTSNGYRFIDPMMASKSELQTGTPNQFSNSKTVTAQNTTEIPDSLLALALARLGDAVGKASKGLSEVELA